MAVNNNEAADFVDAQNQLLAIQAEQGNNIANAKIANQADAAQTETLAQAAQMAMLAGGGGNTSAPIQLNPATQKVLSQYGLGQPRVQKTQTHTQQVTKQNIVINNNTTNTTTNNNNLGYGGPVQGREIMFKQQQPTNDGAGKFKTWLASVFQHQNAQAARREREYNKRERDLSRSAGKLMKKLEGMTKSVTTSLDPRRIGTTIKSQIKSLFLMFGLGALASNWKNILSKVADIEDNIRNFLCYVGLVNGDGKGKMWKDMVYYLGGDPENENIFQALKNFFVGDDGIVGQFRLMFKNFFDDRAAAFKQLKFPEFNTADGVPGMLAKLANYASDILAVLVGGSSAAKNAIVREMNEHADKEMTGRNKDSGWQKDTNVDKGKDFLKSGNVPKSAYDAKFIGAKIKGSNGKWENVKGVSIGEAEVARGKNYLESWNLKNGKLADNTTSAILQSRAVNAMLRDESGQIHTHEVIRGIGNLQESANRNGEVIVDKDFIKSLGLLGVSQETIDKLIKENKKHYKYVIVDKTNEDYVRENADITSAVTEKAVKEGAIEATKKLVGADGFGGDLVHAAAEWGHPTLIGSALGESGVGQKSELIGGLGMVQAATDAWYNKKVSENKKLILVPSTDPRPAVRIKDENGDEKTDFDFYALPAESFDSIKEAVAVKAGVKKEDFDFNLGNTEAIMALDQELRGPAQEKAKTITEGYESARAEAEKWAKVVNNPETRTPEAIKQHEEAQKKYKEEKKKYSKFNKSTEANAAIDDEYVARMNQIQEIEEGQTQRQAALSEARQSTRAARAGDRIGNWAEERWERVGDFFADTKPISYPSESLNRNKVSLSDGRTFDPIKASHNILDNLGVSYLGVGIGETIPGSGGKKNKTKRTNKPSGWCANHVRTALEAGGIDTTGRPGTAAGYKYWLPGQGFTELKEIPKTQMQGDIMVVSGFRKRKNGEPDPGHIAMFTGDRWVSDFTQGSMIGLKETPPANKVSYFRFGAAPDGTPVEGYPETVKVEKEGQPETTPPTPEPVATPTPEFSAVPKGDENVLTLVNSTTTSWGTNTPAPFSNSPVVTPSNATTPDAENPYVKADMETQAAVQREIDKEEKIRRQNDYMPGMEGVKANGNISVDVSDWSGRIKRFLDKITIGILNGGDNSYGQQDSKKFKGGLLGAAFKAGKNTGMQRNYVTAMKPIFEKELESRGLSKDYADYLIAQTALESGWGTSDLSALHNNFGGIKGTDVTMDTTEYENGVKKPVSAGFREFGSAEEFAKAYVDLLENKFDAFSGGTDTDAILDQLVGGDTKYATDPEYRKKMHDMVQSVRNVEGKINPEDVPEILQKLYEFNDKAQTVGDKVADVGKDMYGKLKTGVTAFLDNNVYTQEKPEPLYSGPITSEFLNYKDYLRYNGGGKLKPGMSESEWWEEVKNRTGQLPINLTDRWDREAEKEPRVMPENITEENNTGVVGWAEGVTKTLVDKDGNIIVPLTEKVEPEDVNAPTIDAIKSLLKPTEEENMEKKNFDVVTRINENVETLSRQMVSMAKVVATSSANNAAQVSQTVAATSSAPTPLPTKTQAQSLVNS